jgi:hypothetical protein
MFYGRVAAAPFFWCNEMDPIQTHRRPLIGRVLKDAGVL